MWIWYVSQSNGGNLPSIIATTRSDGISTLIIKAGDGTWSWSQFSPQLVDVLHAAGLRVCAWQYVYGDHPIYEARVAAAAVRAGADCLLIDAESEYEGKYVQAQQYVQELRRLVGSNFPVGLAGFPYIDDHPGFPYSVFLGSGGAQYNVPQMYWPDIGTSPDTVYAHTFDYNELYQRPVEVLGELTGDPAPDQVLRFRALSRPYGASLVSWWDWQGASARDWQAIAEPFPQIQGFTPQIAFPLLSVAFSGGISAGDLVVWAQEHLLEAGASVPVDGQFGTQTQAAVEQFQATHGLPSSGIVDQATWQALLGYPRPNIDWTTQPESPTTGSTGGGATPGTTGGGAATGTTPGAAGDRPRSAITLPVPSSARLPALRDEIPRDLGAGTHPR